MLVVYDAILKQTRKAVQLKFGFRTVWIPESQIGKEDLGWQVMDLPEWLVKTKDLMDYTIDRRGVHG